MLLDHATLTGPLLMAALLVAFFAGTLAAYAATRAGARALYRQLVRAKTELEDDEEGVARGDER